MLTCSKCGRFIAHPGAPHVCEPAQAEAQAPTTAAQASVLTEEDVDALFASSGSIGQFLLALKARLTVGAPAPATAASVLTEDERYIVNRRRALSDGVTKPLIDIIDRLTVGAPAPRPSNNPFDLDYIPDHAYEVGAPAPAATMPTREQIAGALYDITFGGTSDPTLDEALQSLCLSQADAILALFAKGDTP